MRHDIKSVDTARPVDFEPASTSGITIGQIFGRLRANIWFLLLWSSLCVLGCALYLHLREPAYRATATLRIDSGRAQSLGVGEASSGAPVDESNIIQTEIGVLESNRVLLAALRSLSEAEFIGITGVPRGASDAWSTVGALNPQQTKLLHSVQSRVAVTPVTGTQLVSVSFTGQNAALAASMVDDLIAAYQTQSLESRKESVALLRTWLTNEINQLRLHVENAQQKLAHFQESNGILSTSDASNTTTDKLRVLNDRLTQAQADRILKEGQLRAAQGGSPQTLMGLFPDPSFAELQTEQSKLETSYAQMAAKFDSAYPPRVQLEQQLHAVDAELNNRSRSVLNRLEEEYKAANNVQNMLQRQYDGQTALAYAQNRNEAQYAVLLAQVTSDRELLNALQSKLQQSMLNAEVTGIDVVLVDHASVPLSPAGPSAATILASGLLLGLFASAAAVFLSETMTDRVNRAEQLQHTLAAPVFASIPAGLQAMEPPASSKEANVELFRGVRNRLLSHFDGATHKTVLIAGATDHEDVDTLAFNVARCLANAGFTALLVDTNPSHTAAPHVVSLMPAHEKRSVMNLLPEIGQVKHLPNVSLLLPAKAGVASSDDLASPFFTEALQRWSTDFDFTVLIGAPLISSHNSLLLASRTDAFLLVTHYKRTRLSTLVKLRQSLRETGAAATGALLVGLPYKDNGAGL